MAPRILISLEGLNFEGGYRVREMSIYFCETGTTRDYVFNPPLYQQLSENDEKTDFYVRRVLGGLGARTFIPHAKPYEEAFRIINSLSRCHILCVGNVAYKWLRNILPASSIDELQERTGFKYPKVLKKGSCKLPHNPRYCSNAKICYVTNFLKSAGDI